MPYDFLDGCLEYLASQTEVVGFELMISCLLAENDLPPLGTSSKVALWLHLYRHNDVLVLSKHRNAARYEEYIATLCSLCESVSTDSDFLDALEAALPNAEAGFLEYIDNSQLLCSNSLRFRKLNLLFCEQIFKSAERYRILLAVTSRRYNGYWQHELVNDLGISPRDIFTYLMHMSKASILCKISVPQNRIALHLIKTKLNNNAKSGGGSVDVDIDGRDKSSFTTNHQATLWFHTRYFVINRLPDFVQEVCFKTTNKEMEDYLLKVLDESENRIILESDWKHLYSSRMLEDLSALGTRVDGRMVSKSYMSFRRLLESRSKITRVFAWCPQTTRFERCIIPSVCAADILTHCDKVSGPVSTVNVLHLKKKRSHTVSTPEAEHELTSDRTLYQLPSHIHGHTLAEYIYYLVKCHQDGVSVHDVMSYVGIRYKLATRIFSALEGNGGLIKEPVRSGKILMYLYTIKGRSVIPKVAKPMLTASKRDGGVKDTSHVDEAEAAPNAKRRRRTAPDQLANGTAISTFYSTWSADDSENATGHSAPVEVVEVTSDVILTTASQGGIRDPGHVSPVGNHNNDSMTLSYKEWLLKERDMYRTENDYVHRFIELFGSDFVLPKNVNTTLFRHRMVLLVDYVMYFKAASCATISSFYGDMENISTKVDRKTVIRVADFVNLRRPHICRARGQDLEGVNFAVTVIYDSHQLNDYGAFQIVNEGIVKKRHLVSSHSSSLRRRINKSFKGPHDIPETVALSDPLDNTYVGPLSIEPPMLLRDVEVTKQSQAPVNPHGTVSFSQQWLSKNGYIFPVITRVKCLHRFLLELGSNTQRFSALQVLQKMHMDLYLQVIGCGYELNNIVDLFEGNILPVHLEDGVFDAIFKGRGNRDPIHLIHRMLGILSKLNLVKEHHDPLHPGSGASIQECQIEWEVVRFVTLPSFTEADRVIGRFDMLTSSDEFWQALQSEADGYISLDKEEPPEVMPVHELFRKKNWKGSFCVDTKYRTQLDHSISTWFRTTCQGMDCRHLMKIMYMPPYIIKTFMHRHSISQESLFKYISHRIRNHGNCCAEIHGGSSMASLVKSLTAESQYLWLAKFVLAERLCNALFYDRFSCTDDCSLAGTITWGSLRAKFKEFVERTRKNGKHQRPDQLGASVEDKFDNTTESTSDATLVAMANGPVADREKRSIQKSDKVVSSNNLLHCIWDLLSIMFDGLYSSEECRYIFEHIMNKSSLNLRTLCRLRELTAVEVTRCAFKCRVPMYGLATNKIISQDHVKAMLKCLLFTPVVSMRPWFLDSLQFLKRGRSVLRQWSENGWITRTKQSTNMSTLFKLSIFSRVKLFGKVGDLHFMANVLASQLGREIESSDGMAYHQFNHSTSLGSSCARRLVALNSSMPSEGFTCNSDDLDSYSMYSVIEHFVNGSVSFSPVWQNKRMSGGTRESMRGKMSYDRLNDGGLSRHIREMTPDVISIKSVNIAIFSGSSDMRQSRGSNTPEKLHDRSKLLDGIITRELTCGGRFSDVLNPLGCPSLLFTSRISGHYPLCNFEYESDRANDWWTDRNYLSVQLTTNAAVDHDMSALSDLDEHITNTSGCLDDGDTGKTCSATEYKRKHHTPSITNVMLHVIKARFGSNASTLESKLCDMGNYHLYELVCMVMSAGKDGIIGSALRKEFLSNAYKTDTNEMISLDEGDMSVGCAVFEVLTLTAEVLRFITRLASNEEFVYLYWEFSTTLCVPIQPVVGMRQYSKPSRTTVSDCISQNPLERPAYVTPLLWLLYEANVVTELTDDDLLKALGPLGELLTDSEIRKSYLEHRMKAPLGTFTSIDGHLNRCLLAFLMLRIANILKNVPGQSLQEVWEKLVVLDLCEVNLLLRSMIALRMLSRSSIKVESCSNIRHDGGDSSSTLSLHFVREESLWLPKFKHLLLPFLN